MRSRDVEPSATYCRCVLKTDQLGDSDICYSFTQWQIPEPFSQDAFGCVRACVFACVFVGARVCVLP